MESEDLLPLVDDLEGHIEDLEDNLKPLLTSVLSVTTTKLPVLDKAKLYVLVVFSIESLLFSFLRLNGVQAKDHSVYRELTRVKRYFEKILKVEAGPPKPRENLSLNKQAVGRLIKHALAGNDKYDLERAEREARERLLAKMKLRGIGSQCRPVRPAEEGPDEKEFDLVVEGDRDLAQTIGSVGPPRPLEKIEEPRDSNQESDDAVGKKRKRYEEKEAQRAAKKQQKAAKRAKKDSSLRTQDNDEEAT